MSFPLTVAVALALVVILCGVAEYLRLMIISSGGGNTNIEAIKSYFTDELVIIYIATITGFNPTAERQT